MTASINNGIPFVPENVIDLAGGINDALNTIDVLLQLAVLTIGANTPPSGVEGARHIAGTSPAGPWTGQANKLCRYLDGAWMFYDARVALNLADGKLYVRQSTTWAIAAGGSAAWGGISGTLSAQTDLQAALDGKQAINSNLTAFSSLTGAADKLPYFTGVGAMGLTALTAAGRTLLAATDQAGQRAAMALGSAATRAALGTSGSLYGLDSVLGAVSQSGGVPTGAIIESGSNANGEYVRFANGTQICHKSFALNAANTYASGPALWGSDALGSGGYPAGFFSTPQVSAAVTANSGTANSIWASNYSAFSVSNWGAWRVITGDNVPVMTTVHLTAVGRWY